MEELNPDHPVTREAHDHWHKILAILMHKLGMTHAEITVKDIDAFGKSGLGAVTIHPKGDIILLDLVSMKEGERLAKQEGGLPS